MSVEVKKRWAGESATKRVSLTAFREALSELMDGDDRVVALIGDLAVRSGLNELQEQFPDRVINGGSATQNLIGIAAGMASMGKVAVVITSGSPIATASSLLANIVGHTGLHVVVAGLPSGLAGCEGTVGHALNDLGTLAAIPGYRVVSPTDAEETAKALITLVDDEGPGYLRLSSEEVPDITGPDTPFDFGGPVEHREGSQVTLIGAGPLVYQALIAADMLDDEGIDAQVFGAHTLSPIDPTEYLVAARRTGAFVIAEEHVAQGGFGAAISRVCAGSHPIPIEHLHAGPEFVGAGNADALRTALGLDAAAIVEAAKRVIGRKA